MTKFALAMMVLILLAMPAAAQEVTSGQLKAISDKQDKILASLEELKNELAVIKVRVTR
jgi:hypothetical protein